MISHAMFYALGLASGFALPVLFRKSPARIEITEEGHWAFPIDTWAQMLAIPVERRERFLAELPLTFRHVWGLLDQYPLATMPGAVWVDDGLGELRPNVKNAPENVGDAFAVRKLNPEATR